MGRPLEFNVQEALHQALRVFWRKGFEATTLTDLQAATGLSKSSLYATFGDKRELFLAAFDAYRAERAREMELILGRDDGRAAIESFFRKIIADAEASELADGCMSTNQAVELAPHDPEIRRRVEADFQLIEDALERTIRRGQTDGSIRTPRSSCELARLLVVIFPGLQVMVRAGNRGARLEAALRLMLSDLD